MIVSFRRVGPNVASENADNAIDVTRHRHWTWHRSQWARLDGSAVLGGRENFLSSLP
jgi:hypothetical protein